MLRLLVSYDGAGFSGFAAQPGQRTVQGELESALGVIAEAEVKLVCAGRTDAGVHALGQVVSLPAIRDLEPQDVQKALASNLPRDVGVVDAALGPDGFDARLSARWRSYTYLIWNDTAPHPLYSRYATWISRPIDVPALRDALRAVVGTHDFRSFARVRPEQSPTRTVLEATAERDGRLIRIRITAQSFLHQMVRSIVGSALEVASGRRGQAWMREALLACDRARAGNVAPAQGLTLVQVGYDQAPWRADTMIGWPWAGEASSVMGNASGGMSS